MCPVQNVTYLSGRAEGDLVPDAVGRIDMDLLRQVLPFDDYSFYLCGPPGFMAALYQGLTDLNVADHRISYEFFGPATVLKSTRRVEESTSVSLVSEIDLEVEFVTSESKVLYNDDSISILELAKQNDLDVLHSCEEGNFKKFKASLLNA